MAEPLQLINAAPLRNRLNVRKRAVARLTAIDRQSIQPYLHHAMPVSAAKRAKRAAQERTRCERLLGREGKHDEVQAARDAARALLRAAPEGKEYEGVLAAARALLNQPDIGAAELENEARAGEQLLGHGIRRRRRVGRGQPLLWNHEHDGPRVWSDYLAEPKAPIGLPLLPPPPVPNPPNYYRELLAGRPSLPPVIAIGYESEY